MFGPEDWRLGITSIAGIVTILGPAIIIDDDYLYAIVIVFLYLLAVICHLHSDTMTYGRQPVFVVH